MLFALFCVPRAIPGVWDPFPTPPGGAFLSSSNSTSRQGGVSIFDHFPRPVTAFRVSACRLTTIWQMDQGEIAPRLITAYPLEADYD